MVPRDTRIIQYVLQSSSAVRPTSTETPATARVEGNAGSCISGTNVLRTTTYLVQQIVAAVQVQISTECLTAEIPKTIVLTCAHHLVPSVYRECLHGILLI